MGSLFEWITDWIKEGLIDAITGQYTSIFNSVNNQVADVANQVGQTPQGWNGGVFSMIQNLSETVVIPIAGMILNHLYDGTYNKVGCLFADYENRADFSDRNTIIYGHNMRDGSMFALLNRYDEQSYFDAHRQMYLVTPKGGYVMEIFAAFAAKPEESGSETSPWQLSWKDDGAYTTWLTAMKERSAVESDVTVTCSDKVLTLSTCTPGGTGRFLVMGKLVKVDNEI